MIPRNRGHVVDHGFLDESSECSTVFEGFPQRGYRQESHRPRQRKTHHQPQRRSQYVHNSQDSEFYDANNHEVQRHRRRPQPQRHQKQQRNDYGKHRFQRYEDPSFYDDVGDSQTEYETESQYTDLEPVDVTAASRRYEQRKHRHQQQGPRYRRKVPQFDSTLDTTTATESSMCLNVVTITLNLSVTPLLGIQIIGHRTAHGDDGIYIERIERGGAVALDGRLDAGDMILSVNQRSLEEYTNDEAVQLLKNTIMRRGLIQLTVAKSSVSKPKPLVSPPPQVQTDNYVRPIDLNEWVKHVNAMKEAHNLTMGPEPPVYVSQNDVTSLTMMSDYYDRSVVRKVPVKVPKTKKSRFSVAIGRVLNPIRRFLKSKGK